MRRLRHTFCRQTSAQKRCKMSVMKRCPPCLNLTSISALPPKRDPVREDRIYNEAIVDARPEEQAMSWYYYLEGKISFPFRARCVAVKTVSPLRKGETVEVLHMAVEDACEHDMLVQIRWQGRKVAIPLSQLDA